MKIFYIALHHVSYIWILLLLNAHCYSEEKPHIKIWFSNASSGIYQGIFDTDSGTLSSIIQVVKGINSNYIVQHPKLNVLYSINNTKKGGTITSYTINNNGELKLQSSINGRPTGGAHININKEGNLLAVAYYNSGKTGVYSLKLDGSINTIKLEHQHLGKSTNPRRQRMPHPHWVGFSKNGRYIFVPDLGTDHIWIYEYEQSKDKIHLLRKEAVTPGSGPRHLAFHPQKNWVYLAEELSATVRSYLFNEAEGLLNSIDVVPAAKESSDELWANVSDLRVHPSGKFLYVVNRGLDRTSVFQIHPTTGKLTPVEREPIRGSISRNIVLTPDGRWALVAAVKTNSVAVFKVNQHTGALQFMRNHIYSMPTPQAMVIDGYSN